MLTSKDIRNLGYLKINKKYFEESVRGKFIENLERFYSRTSTFNMSYYTLASRWSLIKHLESEEYFKGYYKFLSDLDYSFVKTGEADKRVKDRISYNLKRVFKEGLEESGLNISTRRKIEDASVKIPFVLALVSSSTSPEVKEEILNITTREVEMETFAEEFTVFYIADLINDLLLWSNLCNSLSKDFALEISNKLVSLTPEEFSDYLKLISYGGVQSDKIKL